MNFLDVIILGIVEGVTEFLPISSTGHLILISDILQLPESDFLKTFQIVIQGGAIAAVLLLYWRKLLFDQEIMKRLVVALVPALGIGFLFYTTIRTLFESNMTVVVALFLGGVAIILFEWFRHDKEGALENLRTLPYSTALIVGIFQALAVIPGVSRAGATILGGLLLGMKRVAIVEFSFLLAVPTMIAAMTLDLIKHSSSFSITDVSLLSVGFGVAFVVALVTIKFLMRFVETHTFMVFGIYRIAIALLFVLFIL